MGNATEKGSRGNIRGEKKTIENKWKGKNEGKWFLKSYRAQLSRCEVILRGEKTKSFTIITRERKKC